MGNTTPTQIVDKNGKQTTVHKKTDVNAGAKARDIPVLSVPTAAPRSPFRSDSEARHAAAMIDITSPILKSRLDSMRSLFCDVDEDDLDDASELSEHWEEKAESHARTNLWIDISDAFSRVLKTTGQGNLHAREVGDFIVSHKDEAFNAQNPLGSAIEEYLGMGEYA